MRGDRFLKFLAFSLTFFLALLAYDLLPGMTGLPLIVAIVFSVAAIIVINEMRKRRRETPKEEIDSPDVLGLSYIDDIVSPTGVYFAGGMRGVGNAFERMLQNKYLGLISCVIGGVALGGGLLSLLAFAPSFISVPEWAVLPESVESFSRCIPPPLILLSIVGMALGVGGVAQMGRNRASSILGIVFNITALVSNCLFIGLMILVLFV